jgi:hypothetical protein
MAPVFDRMKLSISLLLGCAVYVSGCSSVPSNLHVSGRFADVDLVTTVDHPIARYYVQRNHAGVERNARWEEAIDEAHARLGERVPTSEELSALSRAHSTDFASLILARQLLHQANRQPLYRAFLSEAAGLAGSEAPNDAQRATSPTDPVIVFVPGWLYESDRKTGADFVRYREFLGERGFKIQMVRSGENAPVEENARLVADAVRALAARGERVLLVSGSKGGPETALALSSLRDDEASRSVLAWVNIGGLLRGTPLADAGLAWPVCWFVWLAVLPDGSFDGIRSLAVERSANRWRSIAIPEHVLVVNYVAVPLSGQVSRQAQGGYSRLREAGPNDGLTFPNEAIVPGGLTIPELGVDHYFRGKNMEAKTLALARVIVRHLQGRDAQRIASAAYRQP